MSWRRHAGPATSRAAIGPTMRFRKSATSSCRSGRAGACRCSRCRWPSLGEKLQGTDAGLAVAIAGAAGAPEGELNLRAGGASVDIDDAGSQVAHRGLGGVDAAGEDGAGEAVARVVVDGDGLFERIDRDEGE